MKSIYEWDENLPQELDFVIDTPPPTVSGLLHMGHVFSYCQTDFIARYKRMMGYNVFYPIGFDDNGLPTERLVEKIYKVKGCRMNKEGRKGEFINMCYNVVNDAEKEFEKLFKVLGISYDWRQKYQTISKSTSDLVIETYNKLKNAGLIEQRQGPVYWDIADQTALAQSIIEDKEIDSAEHYLKCYVEENGKFIDKGLTIMTTRPELLPACVAVFYNPDDNRYNGKNKQKFSLEGKFADLPATANNTKQIPFLADKDVKMDKGTGLVMCCSYGDWQDVEWIRKHNLSYKVIIDEEGRFDGTEGTDGKKKKAIEARKQIIEKIKQEMPERLVEIKPIKHIVKVGERSKEPVEIIDSTQLYIKTLDFKQDLLVLAEHINFHPAHLKNRLISWIEGLNQDWCISRNRFFGIEIPDNGDLQQVFDTWFTSSSSPFICRESERLSRSKGKYDYRLKNITALRPQAHEIIRTWTFSTILKTYLMKLCENNDELLKERNELLKSCNEAERNEKITEWLEKKIKENSQDTSDTLPFLPWGDVMLSGWCLAKDGSKMSKSAGNVITPTKLIEEKGADVVRYWASSCSLGVDTAFNETKFVDGKKLINKLINATKFASMHFKRKELIELIDLKNNNNVFEVVKESADQWIILNLKDIIEEYKKAFNNFEYSQAKSVVESFFWSYCDNYLELCKNRAYNNNISALVTLRILTEAFLLLFAPFIPYVTSDLYDQVFGSELSEKAVHARGRLSSFFDFITSLTSLTSFTSFTSLFSQDLDEETLIDIKEAGKTMLEVIKFIRQKKAEKNISIKAPIKKLYVNKKIEDNTKVRNHKNVSFWQDVSNMLSIEEIIFDSNENDLIVDL